MSTKSRSDSIAPWKYIKFPTADVSDRPALNYGVTLFHSEEWRFKEAIRDRRDQNGQNKGTAEF